jgi:hypothetical protein
LRNHTREPVANTRALAREAIRIGFLDHLATSRKRTELEMKDKPLTRAC